MRASLVRVSSSRISFDFSRFLHFEGLIRREAISPGAEDAMDSNSVGQLLAIQVRFEALADPGQD